MKLILILYLIVINIIGLLLMAIDKKRARNGQWRIQEKVLFLVAIIGGSLGSWAGMYLFHHKTKHWYFVVFMPLILLLQVIALIFLRIN